MKMRLSKILSLFVVTILSSSVFSACATAPEQPTSQVTTWRMIVSPPAYATREETHDLLTKIEARTGGRLIIEQYLSISLGIAEPDLVQALDMGLVDIAAASPDTSGYRWLGFHKLPYFLESPDIDMYKVFAEAQSPMIQELYKQAGIKLITHQGMPSDLSRLLLATKEPVKTLKDLSGMRIGVDTSVLVALVEALGARATFVIPYDVWWALRWDMIDGAIVSPRTAKSYSINEVSQYSIGLWPTMTLTYYGVNEAAFDKLPKDVQSVLLECFEEYSNKSWESVRPGEAEEKWEAVVKEKGLFYTKNFPPEDEAELIKIARSGWAKEIEPAGPKGQQWLDIYEKVTGNKIR